MEVRDLYVRQLKRLVPLEIGKGKLEDLTDDRLAQWAIEICENVLKKIGDSTHLIE